ncbi:TRAP dicarboxylate transporter, DctM subunit [Candidatus Vecturithrix granuli]|uniref:TRAP dicarboxylate transporter, DctM subunit n=1 Tax=Vecturithrix granuli TaxID=1499967 RepID=A0A081BU95_VECG1|nr:TRAP dicarboxylate transporter, DctM subunit [Candidatus Vecturithrix granuli]
MALIMFGILIGFILINIPVAVSIGIAAIAGITFSSLPLNQVVVAQRMFTSVDSFPFMAIPFFMLAGGLMEYGGISKRLVYLASAIVGSLRGGLGLITILASAFFGAISGSNPATVAAIGGIMVPAMIKKGYTPAFAAAIAAAAGTLGVVIPPSIPMITFGVVAGVSIGDLFICGIVPGILMAISLGIVVVIVSAKLDIPKESRSSFAEFLTALRESILAIIMPVIILGGIYGGVFTPTEAGAVAAVYSLIVSTFIYREMSLQKLRTIILKAGISTSVVFFVIATSQSFSWLITVGRVSQAITESMLALSQNPFVIVTLINLLLLFLGIFLETQAIILLVAPIMLPIVTGFGMNPLLLGIIMVVNTSVGMITPPMAVNLFVASSLVKQYNVTIERITKYVLSFLLIEIIDIFIVSNFPAISLGLLRLLK